MSLHKIKDFDPDYRDHFGDRDLKGLSVYSGDDKIGSVDDVLVDDEGQLRYLVIDTGGWILGKKVLLPIGYATIDDAGRHVYANNLTKAQVEALPKFTDEMMLDYNREEQVRDVYRSSMPKMQQDTAAGSGGDYTGYDRDTYTYDQEPELYSLNDQNHPSLKLYEERLVASKTRQKTGETVISKRVETETAQAAVAIEQERVVVERIPANSTTIDPSETNFQAGEVSRMEVYEEVPEFHKETFVREEVRVSKVVDQQTATAQEQLRREELDVDTEGDPVVQQNN